MFTGIITATASIARANQQKDGLKITFKKPAGWNNIEPGESIATNGACLTVSKIRNSEYDVFLMPETLKKTSFGQKIPKKVNLERSLSAKDRFGGHFVQGHVDGIGKVISINKTDGYLIKVKFPAKYKQLVIYKGSVAIDGVSLTVAARHNDTLSVALIPHTVEHTTLGSLAKGDVVNLEFDMIGKYVVNSLELKEHAAS